MRLSDRARITLAQWRPAPQSGDSTVTRIARAFDWLDARCPAWQDAVELGVGFAYLSVLALEFWVHLG